MQRFLRFFKLPLIVTGIVFILIVISGVVGVAWIVKSGGPNTDERAGMLGTGLATLAGIVVAPFWVYGAYEEGKERREALKKAKAQAKSKSAGPHKKSKS